MTGLDIPCKLSTESRDCVGVWKQLACEYCVGDEALKTTALNQIYELQWWVWLLESNPVHLDPHLVNMLSVIQKLISMLQAYCVTPGLNCHASSPVQD